MIINLNTEECILFVPRRGITYALWNGIALSLQQIQQKYGVDAVYAPAKHHTAPQHWQHDSRRFYTDEFSAVVANLTSDQIDPASYVVYTLPGVAFPSNETLPINTQALKPCDKKFHSPVLLILIN